MAYQKDPNELGVLWSKQSKTGQTYFSGTIDGKNVVVFANTNKKSANQPDYRVLLSKPKEQAASAASDEDVPF